MATAHGDPRKLTPEQAVDAQAELDMLLQSEHFSGSKRCCEFLEFVVKNALAGDYRNLTERVLGAELFGRPIDYETASDAIVRVRANDVRRRLAQHYSEERPGSRIRICLSSGSYIPEFHWLSPEATVAPAHESDTSHSLIGAAAASPAATAAAGSETAWQRLTKPLLIAAVLLLAVNAFLMLFARNSAPHGKVLKEFWQPLIRDHRSVIVCFGDTRSYWPSLAVSQAIAKSNKAFVVNPGEISVIKDETITEGNLRAALSVVSLLSASGVSSELLWPKEVQPADLDSSNVIYIGALNNPWSVSLNEGLRFSFKKIQTEAGTIWMIQDSKSPSLQWSISEAYPKQSSTDYALITRIIDREGKRVVISVGGLSQFGTEAAGEFLTDEEALDAFTHSAPGGWQNRNLQIVLGMKIDGRRIVDPKILATNVW